MGDTGRRLLMLMILALVPAVMAGLFHPRRPAWDAEAPGPGEVRLAEARTWDHALWIDARTAAAFARGHVPGALLLTEERWSRDLEAVVNAWTPDRRIVVYCDARSCDAARRTVERLRREVGLDDAWVLRGGWDAWSQGAR